MIDWNAVGTAVIGGVTAIPAAAYVAMRLIRLDRRQDSAAQLADSLRAELAAQVRELTARADAFAAQRNEAIERAAGLSAQVDGLAREVERLRKELEENDARMIDLQRSNEALTQSNRELSKQISALLTENQRLKGVCDATGRRH